MLSETSRLLTCTNANLTGLRDTARQRPELTHDPVPCWSANG